MKKNGKETKKAAAVATDATAIAQTATVESAHADPSQKFEEPAPEANIPLKAETVVLNDVPVAVPVTILVMVTSEANNYFLLRHCLRSLKRHLRGVQAEVKVTGMEKPYWLDDDSWLDLQSPSGATGFYDVLKLTVEQLTTERVVLMTDYMFLLRPVNIEDVALLKAEPDAVGNPSVGFLQQLDPERKTPVWNYKTRMPVMYFRSLLIKVLDFIFTELKNDTLDLPTVYFNTVYPDLQPTLLNWQADGWLLPVISEHPDMERVNGYVAKKKFLFIGGKYGTEMVSLLKFLTPDPGEWEKDIENEHLSQD